MAKVGRSRRVGRRLGGKRGKSKSSSRSRRPDYTVPTWGSRRRRRRRSRR